MDYFKNLKDLLFIDIETVSCCETYDQLDLKLQPLWDRKAFYINHTISNKDLYEDKAAIFAEFGKIVTISLGFFYLENDKLCFKIKSLFGDDEVKILNDFNLLIEKKSNKDNLILVAHNGKEFDYPYLCRRMIINNILLPKTLRIHDKKPWEIKHMDTLELWKFGDKKNFTSLELLATILGIQTSKDDIDGSMVHKVYYKNKDVTRIARYCEKDVIVTAKVFLRLTSKIVLKDENIFLT